MLAADFPAQAATRPEATAPPLGQAVEPGAARVGFWPGTARSLDLPGGATLHSASPTRHGWVAAGTAAVRGRRDLLMLGERWGVPESLPVPPAGKGGPRGEPVVLVSDGALVGLVWLEGTHDAGLAVWASHWRDDHWAPSEEIAPPAARLALAGTVLADRRWLLVWTEFDGTDDETLSVVGRPGDWRSPQRVHAGNDVPDILPALTSAGAGALATWSSFDGADYRLQLARWESDGWRRVRALPGAGATRAELLVGEDRIWLLYRSVEPSAWHLVGLDEQGAQLSRSEFPSASAWRPLVHMDGTTPWLEWPAVAEPASPRLEAEVLPERALSGSSYRYLAFGDSITQGVADECSAGGYPGRLAGAAYLSCSATGCQVVNRGVGGETTAEGVTRLENALDSEGPWDTVLVMEGTNDICWHDVSSDTIEANLAAMEALATERGVDTLHASIIHLRYGGCPSSYPDSQARVADLRDRIRDHLANVDGDTGHRWWVDPWSELCPTESCFDEHYADWGHPDCSGYDILTEVFRGAIQALPAPGESVAVEPSGAISTSTPTFRWTKESLRDATWYQFQLDGPSGSLDDAWLPEAATCADWECTRTLGTLGDGLYTWRVRGRNAAGRSPWVVTTFTIGDVLPPGEPTPITPAGVVGDDRPAFTWGRESPIAATDYELEISGEEGLLLSLSTGAGAACNAATCSVDPFDQGEPLAAGPSTWRVRGSNLSGVGPWSEPLAFMLGPDLLLADGFEGGDTIAWSVTLP